MDDAIRDLKWLLLFLLVVGIIWLATGGLYHPAADEGPFVTPVTPTSRGFGYGTDRIFGTDSNTQTDASNKPLTNTNTNTQSGGTNASGQTNSSSSLYTPPTSSTSMLNEPKYNIEFDNYNNNLRSIYPSQEYLRLTLNSGATKSVPLTGMTLQSVMTGQTVQIGTASILPFVGGINAKESIYVAPGDTVIVVSGRSPIGTSFKVNKCTGYFEQNQNFYPSLDSYNCPRPIDENLPLPPNALNDKCLDFVENLQRCQIFTGTYPDGVGQECKQWVVDNVNYNNCIKVHKNDSDFYKKEWRIYLDRDQELWKEKRELIKLIDQSGKTIDTLEISNY